MENTPAAASPREVWGPGQAVGRRLSLLQHAFCWVHSGLGLHVMVMTTQTSGSLERKSNGNGEGVGRAQLPCILGMNLFIRPLWLQLRLREVKSCTDPETLPQKTGSRRLLRAERLLSTGLPQSPGIAQRCLRVLQTV